MGMSVMHLLNKIVKNFNTKMRIYHALYCADTRQVGSVTISLRRTKGEAVSDMERHKEKKRKFFNSVWAESDPSKYGMEFGTYESWAVEEVELLD